MGESYDEVILLFDGDDPGRAAMTTVGRQLLDAVVHTTAPFVPIDFKPHRVSEELLDGILL